MIANYRDHAANERTYLAWVRTGITEADFPKRATMPRVHPAGNQLRR